MAAFPGNPSLAERDRTDQANGLYADLFESGDLIISAGRTVNLGQLLREAYRRYGRPGVIVCDRFRQAELLDAVNSSGIKPMAIVYRGFGWRDGSEDIRAFRRALLDGEIQAPKSLLLRSALNEARTIADLSGNEKLAKGSEGGRRSRARDDVVSALVIAVGEGVRRRNSLSTRRVPRHAVI